MDAVALRKTAESELRENILAFWIRHGLDRQYGGITAGLTEDLKPFPGAKKSLVLCTRMVWTFAKAYRTFQDPAYLEAADWAYEALEKQFHDTVHGGYFWMVDVDGTPHDRTKEVYGQAFTIYGLSEYYLATQKEEALDKAKDLFELLEKYAHDDEEGGYLESFAEDWSLLDLTIISHGQRGAVKSMNTHLHLLEAMTNLYRAWHDKQVETRLKELIDVFLKHIVDSKTAHELLFFSKDWVPTSKDVSYGHDIEASWLVTEAAQVLGDPGRTSKANDLSLRMAEAIRQEGQDEDGGILNELHENGHLDANKHWWPQAEGVVGFLNAYQLSGDEEYLNASTKTWDFIDRFVIDREYGEWHGILRRDGSGDNRQPKVSEWKCPYHNARACFEVMERVDHITGAHS